MPEDRPLLYSDLAGWFHLLTAPEDYEEEAEIYRKAIVNTSKRKVKTVLELGSGGGNNASHMKAHFDMTLTDLSPDMLEISRGINPELEHIEGNMCTLRLGRTFDAVFAHDAVSYLLDEESVRQAVATAFEHLEPGGAALFAPDDYDEGWEDSYSDGGHDGPDGRGLRYIEWSHRGGLEPPRYVFDFGYLLREADGSVRAVHDRHYGAAHPRDTWRRAFEDAGFVDVEFQELTHSEVEPGTHWHIVALKPR
jgi:SAM-dependent methyltransferase